MPQVTYTTAKGLVQSAGAGFSLGGEGVFSGDLKNVPAALTAASTTLTAADSGKVYLLTPPGTAATRTVTLPTAASGIHFRFILTAAGSASCHFDVVQAGNTQDFVGTIISGGGTSDSAGASDTKIRFTGGSSAAGDNVDLVSDGTSWYVRGSCKNNNGAQFA